MNLEVLQEEKETRQEDEPEFSDPEENEGGPKITFDYLMVCRS